MRDRDPEGQETQMQKDEKHRGERPTDTIKSEMQRKQQTPNQRIRQAGARAGAWGRWEEKGQRVGSSMQRWEVGATGTATDGEAAHPG